VFLRTFGRGRPQQVYFFICKPKSYWKPCRFSFVPSQTSLILTKFLEKITNIYMFKVMHCQDIFH
jgi:hypothetical protein